MKRLYLFIVTAALSMPIVYAQSIFRGKTVRLDDIKFCLSTDENDNGIMTLEQDAGSGVSIKYELKCKDYSTKKLLYIEKDFSTLKLIEIDNGTFRISKDGRLWDGESGEEVYRERNPKLFDEILRVYAPIFDEGGKKLREVFKGQNNTVKFQIAYIDEEKMLAPKPNCLENGSLSDDMDYYTFTIENNSAQPSK